MKLRRKRHLWILGLLAVVAVVAVVVLVGKYDVRERMLHVVAAIREAGPVPFFVAMALLPAVGFPLSAFTLVAGPVFGPTLGLGAVVAGAMLAITANVALSYWLAAWAMRPAAEWIVRRLGYRLPEPEAKTAWLAIVILRVVPVTPFFLQGLLLGLARVPFGLYMLVSVLVPSAYAVAIVTLGDALMRGDPWAIAGAGGLVVLIGTVLHFVRVRVRSKSNAPRSEEKAGGSGSRTKL